MLDLHSCQICFPLEIRNIIIIRSRYELHGKINNVELRRNVGYDVLSSHYACLFIAAASSLS